MKDLPFIKNNPEFSTPHPTKDHVAMAEGMADAFKAMKGKPGHLSDLYDKVKSDTTISFADYARDSVSMMTAHYQGKTYLVLNTNTTPLDTDDPGWTVAIKASEKVQKKGASREDIIREQSKYAFWHEAGHVLDTGMYQGVFTHMLADQLKSSIGMAGAVAWVKENISPYGATSATEAFAEAATMVIAGQHLPKQLSELEKTLTGTGKPDEKRAAA
jgi:hypothetical protein